MDIEARVLRLELRRPFRLAHGTSTVRENVLLRLLDGEGVGQGEAAVVPYYSDTTDDVLACLRHPGLPRTVASISTPDEIEGRLPASIPGAARAAIDMALHDLWGQRQGRPVYRRWGLDPARAPRSSFTVALDSDEERYRGYLRGLEYGGPIKLKLGSGDPRRDLRLVQIAREEIDGALCVDVNGGWSLKDALWIIPRLAPAELSFIEQPLGREDLQGWRALSGALDPAERPPLIADESIQGLASLDRIAGLADGVNIKLAKCGGLAPARRMIDRARALKMKVMLGCMIESSLAVTAAAHLAPLADHADLDGHLLLANDPFRGARLEDGWVRLPTAPGLGVRPADAAPAAR